MCVFGVVAVQGGMAPWSVSVLIVTVVVCLILVFVVLRQPQSKAKLAFKVSFLLKLHMNDVMLSEYSLRGFKTVPKTESAFCVSLFSFFCFVL